MGYAETAIRSTVKTSMTPEEREFHRAMVEIYERAKREAGYTATRFVQMVAERGGVQTAKSLLATGDVSEGFTAL